jgi:hypothetical protein
MNAALESNWIRGGKAPSRSDSREGCGGDRGTGRSGAGRRRPVSGVSCPAELTR